MDRGILFGSLAEKNMHEEWFVRIHDVIGTVEMVEVYFYCKYGNGKIGYLKDGTVTQLDIGANQTIPATMIVPKSAIKAFLNEANEMGIKLPDAGKVSGQFEAQSKHLEDLRHLLKLPK